MAQLNVNVKMNPFSACFGGNANVTSKEKKEKKWDKIFKALDIKTPKALKTGFKNIDNILSEEAKRSAETIKACVTDGLLLVGWNRIHRVYSHGDSAEVMLGKLLKHEDFVKWWENTASLSNTTESLEDILLNTNWGDTYCTHIAAWTGLSKNFSEEYSELMRKERVGLILEDVGKTDVFLANLIAVVEFVAGHGEELLTIQDTVAKSDKTQASDDVSSVQEEIKPVVESIMEVLGRRRERIDEIKKKRKEEKLAAKAQKAAEQAAAKALDEEDTTQADPADSTEPTEEQKAEALAKHEEVAAKTSQETKDFVNNAIAEINSSIKKKGGKTSK